MPPPKPKENQKKQTPWVPTDKMAAELWLLEPWLC